MKDFLTDIGARSAGNATFRTVLETADHCELVITALKVGEDIGMEVHELNQFFRVELGSGEAVLDCVTPPISDGFAVLVSAGTQHNTVNTGTTPLKLYTLYTPPNHRDGVVHRPVGKCRSPFSTRSGASTPPP